MLSKIAFVSLLYLVAKRSKKIVGIKYTSLLKAQISEIDKKIERTEERYMEEEEITQELYVKYASKIQVGKAGFNEGTGQIPGRAESSNLEDDAEFALRAAQTISKIWASGEY